MVIKYILEKLGNGIAYEDLDDDSKIALCHFLIAHAHDTCDDPGWDPDEDLFDEKGMEKVKYTSSSTRGDRCRENHLSFVIDNLTCEFNYLSSTNWEEDLSKLYYWSYSVTIDETLLKKSSVISDDDFKCLLNIAARTENVEFELSEVRRFLDIIPDTVNIALLKDFIKWTETKKIDMSSNEAFEAPYSYREYRDKQVDTSTVYFND